MVFITKIQFSNNCPVISTRREAVYERKCSGQKGGTEGRRTVPISEDGPHYCPTVVFTSRHCQPGHAKNSGVIV